MPANPYPPSGAPQGPPPGQWTAPAPPEPAPRGRRRGITIGIAAVAVVAVVAGASVFAWSKLSGGGPQPAEAIPSDAIAYVRLDLDPSAEQKLNAMSLLQRWPEFEDATGISEDDVDLRKLFVDEALSTDGCDVDYEDDIKPWIGDRLGFAVLPGDDTPSPLLAVQVKDEDKAKAGAKKLGECMGDGLGSSPMSGAVTESAYGSSVPTDATASDSKAGIAFSGDYMLVAETQDLADEYAADAQDKSLASSQAFSDDMAALDDEGIASMWYDGAAFVDVAEQMGAPPGMAESLSEQDLGTTAAALRAGEDYLELAGVSTGDVGLGDGSSDVDQLPESTMAAVSVSNGQKLVDKFWSQFETMSGFEPRAGAMLQEMQTRSGLQLPDDIGTLLGDQAMLAVDSEGLDPDAPPQQISEINAGARLTGDPDEIGGVLDKLNRSAGPVLGQLVTEDTDDGVVIATNDDYAATLTDGGGSLGDSDVFGKAVPDGADASNVVFVNLDRIAALGDGMGEDFGPIEPVEAFGFSTSQQDGETHATMRLTFDE